MTAFYYRYLDKSYVPLSHKSSLSKRATEIFNQKFFDIVHGDVITQFVILLKKQSLDPQLTSLLAKVYAKFDQDECGRLKAELNQVILAEKEKIFRDIKSQMQQLENQDDKIEYVQEKMNFKKQFIQQVFNGREIEKDINKKFNEIVISSLQDQVINNLENMIQNLENNAEYDKLKKLFELIETMDPELTQLKKECGEIFTKSLASQYNAIFDIKEEWPKQLQINYQCDQTKQLINVFKYYQKIIEKQFNKSQKIQNQLKDSLSLCMKRRFVQIFLRYIDRDLYKAKQEIGEEQNQAVNNFTIILENYREKDDIINQYWIFVSQKLLKQRNDQRLQNTEFEELFFKLMKKMCGQDATEKISEILKDYKTQSEHTKEEIFFENIYIQCTYLRKDIWPNFVDFNQNVLPGLEKQEQYVLDQQRSKHKNMIVQISNISSVVTLITYNQAQRLILIIPVYHAQVLFYFQYCNNPVPLEQIKSQLRFSDSYFEKVITDLQRHNLIIRKDNHILYNEQYKQPKLIIPLHIINQETHKDNEEIQINRANIIQALIVKIMKARKKFKIQDLMVEIRRKIELFDVDSQQAKQVIEFLIRNDYLERNMSDINELIYKS